MEFFLFCPYWMSFFLNDSASTSFITECSTQRLSVFPSFNNHFWRFTKEVIFYITFDRHEMFLLFPMDMEFPVFIMITCHYQFSFDVLLFFFKYLVHISLLIGSLVFFMSLRYHDPPILVNKVEFFSWRFRIWFLTSVVIFKYFFRLILIGQTTTCNVLVQCFNPNANKINSDTKRNKNTYT